MAGKDGETRELHEKDRNANAGGEEVMSNLANSTAIYRHLKQELKA